VLATGLSARANSWDVLMRIQSDRNRSYNTYVQQAIDQRHAQEQDWQRERDAAERDRRNKAQQDWERALTMQERVELDRQKQEFARMAEAADEARRKQQQEAREKAEAEREAILGDLQRSLGAATNAGQAGDLATAAFFLRHWATKDDPSVTLACARLLQTLSGKAGSPEAYQWFVAAAKAGSAAAAYEAGRCLVHGRGTATNFNDAMKWLTIAAQAAQLGAYVETATVCHATDSFWHDEDRATMYELYLSRFSDEELRAVGTTKEILAALIRNSRTWGAYFRLGQALEKGSDSLPTDPSEAFAWLHVASVIDKENPAVRAACEAAGARIGAKGKTQVLMQLGDSWLQGNFHGVNLMGRSGAVECWKEAAKLGNVPARLRIAEALSKADKSDVVVKKAEPVASLAWYLLAGAEPGPQILLPPEGAQMQAKLQPEERVQAYALAARIAENDLTTKLVGPDTIVGLLTRAG
jgi:TPR repeat protein